MDEKEHPTGAPPEPIDRRNFLNASWKVLGVALVVEAGWTSYDILNPKPSGGFGGVVDAGLVEDFLTEGTVKYFLDGRFYVTQYQGGLRALYQKCPHLGCKVGACVSNDVSDGFRCPCHGSQYNVIGEYLSGPAPRGMDRFPISIQNGHVMVDTSAFVEGPARGLLTGPKEPPTSCGEGAASGSNGGMPSEMPSGMPMSATPSSGMMSMPAAAESNQEPAR